MAISYISEKVKVPSFKRREISAWVRKVADQYGMTIGEIAYLFCDDETILEMNRKYLEHDYPTDILTFGQEVEGILFADIVISLDTVTENAQTYNESFHNELLRVMIHGILHLCGIQDKTEEESLAMRQAEEEALGLLPEDRSLLWRG